MKILKATYGTEATNKNITMFIKSKVVGGSLIVRADNSLCGDPVPGVRKTLRVSWADKDGKVHNESCQEGDWCVIPKTNNKRLGIFYTNNMNNNTAPTIQLALKSIKKAAGSKVDILTNVWNKIPNNPFTETMSWYKQSSHLNQTLQILQLLYIAKNLNDYDYVTFLEHDVLYAEGCFDYPEFEEGFDIYANMNYGGLCETGWQLRSQNDRPLSQMTMRFGYAISHFEKVLSNALVTNSGCVETGSGKIKTWDAPNECIHVNHGYHFTSHCNIYSKQKVTKNHDYWGNYEQFLPLFKKPTKEG
jgi:hypothetical protein